MSGRFRQVYCSFMYRKRRQDHALLTFIPFNMYLQHSSEGKYINFGGILQHVSVEAIHTESLVLAFHIATRISIQIMCAGPYVKRLLFNKVSKHQPVSLNLLLYGSSLLPYEGTR